MKVNLIAAMDRRRGIGSQGKLPWNLPKELQLFKRLTQGYPVIMGRKTFESIGRPLPKRLNIVVSKTLKDEDVSKKVWIARRLKDAFAIAEEAGHDECFVIGGATLYEQAMKTADCLYLTEIHHLFESCDTYFPLLSPENRWHIVSEKSFDPDEDNLYPFTFRKWARKSI
jgi:dihydrofolate reductase